MRRPTNQKNVYVDSTGLVCCMSTTSSARAPYDAYSAYALYDGDGNPYDQSLAKRMCHLSTERVEERREKATKALHDVEQTREFHCTCFDVLHFGSLNFADAWSRKRAEAKLTSLREVSRPFLLRSASRDDSIARSRLVRQNEIVHDLFEYVGAVPTSGDGTRRYQWRGERGELLLTVCRAGRLSVEPASDECEFVGADSRRQLTSPVWRDEVHAAANSDSVSLHYCVSRNRWTYLRYEADGGAVREVRTPYRIAIERELLTGGSSSLHLAWSSLTVLVLRGSEADQCDEHRYALDRELLAEVLLAASVHARNLSILDLQVSPLNDDMVIGSLVPLLEAVAVSHLDVRHSRVTARGWSSLYDALPHTKKLLSAHCVPSCFGGEVEASADAVQLALCRREHLLRGFGTGSGGCCIFLGKIAQSEVEVAKEGDYLLRVASDMRALELVDAHGVVSSIWLSREGYHLGKYARRIRKVEKVGGGRGSILSLARLAARWVAYLPFFLLTYLPTYLLTW